MLSQRIPRFCLVRMRMHTHQFLVCRRFVVFSHSRSAAYSLTTAICLIVLDASIAAPQALKACWLLQSKIDEVRMTSQNVVDRTFEGEDDDVLVAFSLGAGVPEDVGFCRSKQIYVDSGNDKKVLFMLSIGLRFNDQPLFSVDDEPWSTLPKTVLRPRNNDFVNEVLRRAKDMNMNPLPRPSNWNRLQTMEWLERNPFTTDADVEFLTNEVLRLRDVLLRRAREQEEQQQANTGRGGRGHWRGCVPYLRIIMCLTRDDVKCLFLTRANTMSRAELDARNSDTRYVTNMLRSCLWCCGDCFVLPSDSFNCLY